MTDDELVETPEQIADRILMRWYNGCEPSDVTDCAHEIAAAVREAVLKRVMVCDECGGRGRVWDDSSRNELETMDCPTCHGRGVGEGET